MKPSQGIGDPTGHRSISEGDEMKADRTRIAGILFLLASAAGAVSTLFEKHTSMFAGSAAFFIIGIALVARSKKAAQEQ